MIRSLFQDKVHTAWHACTLGVRGLYVDLHLKASQVGKQEPLTNNLRNLQCHLLSVNICLGWQDHNLH